MMKPKFSPLFNTKLIEAIFSSSVLYEKKSFYVIENQGYDERCEFDSFSAEVMYLKKSYDAGKAIIVKNLENFDETISKRALDLGPHTDVHLYITPNEKAESFPFHTDDRDVVVHLLYGHKKFELKEGDNITAYELNPGDELVISKGTEHRAIPMGASALLSFGTLVNYYVPGGMDFEFIGRNHF